LANEGLQPAHGRFFVRGDTGNFRFLTKGHFMATTTKTIKKTTTKRTNDGVSHLSKESQEFYRKTVDRYELDDHHLLLLTKAMEAHDLAEKCRKILDKEGLVYTDRFGSPRARPETKILNDSRNAVKNIFRELGFDLADDNNSRPPLIAGRYQ
jgi:phage terminase small subunit